MFVTKSVLDCQMPIEQLDVNGIMKATHQYHV
jgi:hypothetical protein